MLLDKQVTFNQILEENNIVSELDEMLVEHYLNAGGTVSLLESEMIFDQTKFDLDTLEGSIVVHYTIEFYFSCDDLTNTKWYEERFDVTFDRENLNFTIHSSIKWELDN